LETIHHRIFPILWDLPWKGVFCPASYKVLRLLNGCELSRLNWFVDLKVGGKDGPCFNPRPFAGGPQQFNDKSFLVLRFQSTLPLKSEVVPLDRQSDRNSRLAVAHERDPCARGPMIDMGSLALEDLLEQAAVFPKVVQQTGCHSTWLLTKDRGKYACQFRHTRQVNAKRFRVAPCATAVGEVGLRHHGHRTFGTNRITSTSQAAHALGFRESRGIPADCSELDCEQNQVSPP
jgi:hypothetical protein